MTDTSSAENIQIKSSDSSDPQKKTFGLLVPANLRCLDNVRKMISDLARTMGFSAKAIGQIEVAVDEACSNAIEHAYIDLDEKLPIHIEACVEGDSLIIDVIDSGKGFDFSLDAIPKFPEHWCDEGNVRGAGLFLISQCMDEISYDRLEDKRNRMRMIKSIPKA